MRPCLGAGPARPTPASSLGRKGGTRRKPLAGPTHGLKFGEEIRDHIAFRSAGALARDIMNRA
eukprot:scaffold62570_cov36-Phaeocystis_antarctica.AAC.1